VPVVLLLLILAAIIGVVWYWRYVGYLVAFYHTVRANCKGYVMKFLDACVSEIQVFQVSPVWLLLKYSGGEGY